MLQEENRWVTECCNELTETLANTEIEKSQVEGKLEKQLEINSELQKNQQRLVAYIEQVESLHSIENKGKVISDIGERQQRRKLKELKTKFEQLSWFAKTFGLNLSSVHLTDDNGVHHKLSYSAEPDKSGKSFKHLRQNKKWSNN